jgi:hypothetical protein
MPPRRTPAVASTRVTDSILRQEEPEGGSAHHAEPTREKQVFSWTFCAAASQLGCRQEVTAG